MTIEIEDFYFNVIIGVLDKERITPQKVIIHFVGKYTYNGKYINYALVKEYIQNTLINEKFFVLEEALIYLLDNIKVNFKNFEYLYIQIKKPSIIENAVVCVADERSYFKEN
jgi:dihydroneopterin aldolase